MSHHPATLPSGIEPKLPLTALAPMQDVTTLDFMKVISHYGPPDYFFTEYFRVHTSSTPEKHILTSITHNPSTRPVFAQIIGESLPDIQRTIEALHQYPIAGVDLNMGCPAPKVYRKNVGGGLLREPDKIAELLSNMRRWIPGLFTVKMRIGFEDMRHFDEVLSHINAYNVNLLSLHGRTVKEMYRSEVHYDAIAHAVQKMKCPVLANGNITSAQKAQWTLNFTGCSGVMIGRSAIRNPWIFRQTRELLSNQPVFSPTLADVRDYVERLIEVTYAEDIPDKPHTSRMKKFLNFVGLSVDPEGLFLTEMRRATIMSELLKICDKHLLTEPQKPFADEPYTGIIARPNCETPPETQTCNLFETE